MPPTQLRGTYYKREPLSHPMRSPALRDDCSTIVNRMQHNQGRSRGPTEEELRYCRLCLFTLPMALILVVVTLNEVFHMKTSAGSTHFPPHSQRSNATPVRNRRPISRIAIYAISITVQRAGYFKRHIESSGLLRGRLNMRKPN